MKDKRGRRLTRRQKIIISKVDKRINPDNWLCTEDNQDFFIIRDKAGNKYRKYTYDKAR